MGNLLPSYKKALFEELVNSISSNTSQYYAYASNPKEYTGLVPETTKDIYSSNFENSWNMIFGKKITENDIMPVIKKNLWQPGVVYDQYDNNSETIFDDNNYYVITQPELVGGDYYVYKCIGNANGNISTVDPQSGSTNKIGNFITEPDQYVWRYVTTISSALYNKFATSDYAPVYPDTTVSTSAGNNSGIDAVLVVNNGIGYSTYDNGLVQQVNNSTTVRIGSPITSNTPGFYAGCSIYFYGTNLPGVLKTISQYVCNSVGNWVITSNSFELSDVVAYNSNYIISPKVNFETDAITIPQAYSVVDPSSNTISSIVVINNGSNVSWANASVQTTIYGTGAKLQAVVSPPGGHSGNPEVELNMQGYCISFGFNNNENDTIVSNTAYNKIGLIKNPYSINSVSGSKTSRYSANTFSSVVKASVSHTFNKGEIVKGATTGALGTVVFANSSQVFLVGDKDFVNGEFLSNTTALNITAMNITTRGDLYTKDIIPLYVQNINNVDRQPNQSESFKIIIKL